MRKLTLFLTAILLVAALFTSCDTPAATEPQVTEAPASATVETAAPTDAPTEAPAEAATESVPVDSEEDIVYEGDASSYYIDVAYAEQIGRYHTALVEKWNEDKYIENGMSEVLAAYYEGNPLDNVGFGFVDLDNDGRWELVIGAIQDAETAPAVFEIWTLVDDEPVMVAQAGARCQYALQYVEEDNAWYVANEEVESVSCHGTYYLMLSEGMLEVTQGIMYDAEADEKNPWFMTYDMDWDVSNDEPIDEEMAYAIMDSHSRHYIALEYFPYIFY